MNEEYLKVLKSNECYSFMFDEDLKVSMVMTDDLDSILSCLLLKMHKPNWSIDYFYGFNEGMYIRQGTDITREKVGIDLSYPNKRMKSISNHCTRVNERDEHNKYDLNLNHIEGIYLKNYFSKFNLSSFMLIASLLGFKFNTRKAKCTCLLADSSYKAYYQPAQYKDHGVQKRFLCDILGYAEVWKNQSTLTKADFEKGQTVLHTRDKIYIDNDGKLKVGNMKLEKICEMLEITYDESLFDEDFILIQKHRSMTNNIGLYNKENMYSFAITSKSKVKYSRPVITY